MKRAFKIKKIKNGILVQKLDGKEDEEYMPTVKEIMNCIRDEVEEEYLSLRGEFGESPPAMILRVEFCIYEPRAEDKRDHLRI